MVQIAAIQINLTTSRTRQEDHEKKYDRTPRPSPSVLLIPGSHYNRFELDTLALVQELKRLPVEE